MSDMKCPFCQQELKPQTMDGEWLECWNCSYHEPSHHPFPQRILCGTKAVWQELIRTRKALDIAVDALKDIRCIYTGDQTTKPSTMFGRAASALNKIQDIEQKD